MIFRHYLFAIAIAAATTLSTPLLHHSVAIAQQPQIPPQLPLTKDLVKRFLSAYPDLKALSKKYGKGTARGSNAGQGAADSVWEGLQAQAAKSEVESIVKAHGFSSYDDWIGIARSIALAYSFAKSDKSPQQLSGQADTALAAIRANPNLSAAQKQQMEAMVAQQLGQLNQLKPPAGNLAIVKEMESEIAAVMDRDRR